MKALMMATTLALLAPQELPAEREALGEHPTALWIASGDEVERDAGDESNGKPISFLGTHRLPVGGETIPMGFDIIPRADGERGSWVVSVLSLQGAVDFALGTSRGSYVARFECGRDEPTWRHDFDVGQLVGNPTVVLRGADKHRLYAGYRQFEPEERKDQWAVSLRVVEMAADSGEVLAHHKGTSRWPLLFGKTIDMGYDSEGEGLLFLGRRGGESVGRGLLERTIEVSESAVGNPLCKLTCPLSEGWRLTIDAPDAFQVVGDLDGRGTSDLYAWVEEWRGIEDESDRDRVSMLTCMAGEDGALLGQARPISAGTRRNRHLALGSDVNGDGVSDLLFSTALKSELSILSGTDLSLLRPLVPSDAALRSDRWILEIAGCPSNSESNPGYFVFFTMNRAGDRSLAFRRGSELEPAGILELPPCGEFGIDDVRCVGDVDADGLDDLVLIWKHTWGEWWSDDGKDDYIVTLLGTRSLGL